MTSKRIQNCNKCARVQDNEPGVKARPRGYMDKLTSALELHFTYFILEKNLVGGGGMHYVGRFTLLHEKRQIMTLNLSRKKDRPFSLATVLGS